MHSAPGQVRGNLSVRVRVRMGFGSWLGKKSMHSWFPGREKVNGFQVEREKSER